VDSSISQDSDTGSADAPTSKPAGSVLKQLVLATPKQSSYSLYGSHAADGTVFTAQQLQEWPVQDCKDYVVGLCGGIRSGTALCWKQLQLQRVLTTSDVQQLCPACPAETMLVSQPCRCCL
jgi:hypothetical protein